MIVGVGLGSQERIRMLLEAPNTPTADAATSTNAGAASVNTPLNDAAPIRSAPSRPQIQETTDPMPSPAMLQSPAAEPDPHIFAARGLQLIPARIGDRFIGYRVLRNDSDSRFEAGDIIVAIGGQKVEDSAAGNELLIAGLTDGGQEVELYVEDRH